MLKEKRITLEQIIGWKDYFDSTELPKFFNGKGYITAEQIFNAGLSIQDKIWILSNRCFIPVEKYMVLFIEFVMRVIPIWQTYHPDGNNINVVVDSIRRYVDGDIGDDELLIEIYSSLKSEEKVPFIPSLKESWEVILRHMSNTIAYIMARYGVGDEVIRRYYDGFGIFWESKFQDELEWQLNKMMEIINA